MTIIWPEHIDNMFRTEMEFQESQLRSKATHPTKSGAKIGLFIRAACSSMTSYLRRGGGDGDGDGAHHLHHFLNASSARAYWKRRHEPTNDDDAALVQYDAQVALPGLVMVMSLMMELEMAPSHTRMSEIVISLLVCAFVSKEKNDQPVIVPQFGGGVVTIPISDLLHRCEEKLR